MSNEQDERDSQMSDNNNPDIRAFVYGQIEQTKLSEKEKIDKLNKIIIGESMSTEQTKLRQLELQDLRVVFEMFIANDKQDLWFIKHYMQNALDSIVRSEINTKPVESEDV